MFLVPKEAASQGQSNWWDFVMDDSHLLVEERYRWVIAC